MESVIKGNSAADANETLVKMQITFARVHRALLFNALEIQPRPRYLSLKLERMKFSPRENRRFLPALSISFGDGGGPSRMEGRDNDSP